MENGASKWNFEPNPIIKEAGAFSIRKLMYMLFDKAETQKDTRRTIKIGHGDPSSFSCFQVTKDAEDAIVLAVRSGQFNGYVPGSGVPSARCGMVPRCWSVDGDKLREMLNASFIGDKP